MKFVVLSLLSICSFYTNANRSEFEVIQMAENVYQHVSYAGIKPWGRVAASGLVFVEGKNAYLIDTPWTSDDTERLVLWADAKGLNIKSVVVTHFHQDASGGLNVLNTLNVQTFATTLTNELLKKAGRETAKNEIKSDVFELAEGSLVAYYPGPSHSMDNIVVWLPKLKILFGGCFVKSIKSRSLGNIADASVHEWSNSIRNIVEKYPDIQVVVPGHGKAGGIELLENTVQLVADKIGDGKALK